MTEDINYDEILKDDTVAEEPPATDVQNLPEKLIRIKFLHSNETEFCEYPQTFQVNHADYVIATSKYGKDFAKVLGSYILNTEKEKLSKIRTVQQIVRKATAEDVEKYNQNREKADEAFNICKEKISNHKLEMKLVSAYYLFEEPKVLFFFTADTRVDFRELVKDLVTVFKMRIELRQIGVRDEPRVLGGLGVCGRDYCCHGLTDKLNPVSIKMAKDQNLSLNSMKISGICGRLLCCLSYEFDFYQEERAKFPAEGVKIFAGERSFRVLEVNVLTKTVKMEGADSIVVNASLNKFEFDQKKSVWNYIEN